MRAWTPPIQAWKSGSVAPTVSFVLRRSADFLERLENVAFENLHLLLGGFQPLLAEARELEAALVRGERLLEGKLAAFHARDDLLELGERLLEAQLGRLR